MEKRNYIVEIIQFSFSNTARRFFEPDSGGALKFIDGVWEWEARAYVAQSFDLLVKTSSVVGPAIVSVGANFRFGSVAIGTWKSRSDLESESRGLTRSLVQ